MSPLRKFFTHYSHFLTSSVCSLLFGLISFPILTRITTKEEYGIIGLVTTTMLLSVAVSKAGLSEGIVRLYGQHSEDADQRAVFSSTVFVRGVVLAVVTVLLYVCLFSSINKYVGINEQFVHCFKIMAAYLFIRPLNIIVYQLLRVNGKTIFMNVVGGIGGMISFCLGLLMFLYVFHGIYGYFIGVIVGEFVVALILFRWFFTNYKVALAKVSRDLTVRLIQFGLPLLFTELSYLLLTYIDRYMIVAYQGEAMLGLYSVGYTMATYITNIVMVSLSWAIVPIYVEIYEKEGREKTEDFLRKSLQYLLILIIPVILGYVAVAKDVLTVLASGKYTSASTFSPIILIGSFSLGMNNILNAGLYLKKKSFVILFIMVTALLINVVANLILLPRFGVTGAAVSTLIACLTATGLTIAMSYKYIVVKVDIKNVAYYLMLSCLMFVALGQIELHLIWLNLLVKIVMGILMITLGVLLREKGILRKIKGIYDLKKSITASQ